MICYKFGTTLLLISYLLYPVVCEVGDCDFDDNLCDWTNSFDDQFDWGRRRFPTRTPLTGPTGDHTSGSGRFVYLEGNNARDGSSAKLVSPVLSPSKSSSELNILYFWYSMWDLLGGNMGTLKVWIMHDGRLGDEPIWSKNGPQTKRSEWREVELVLHSASPFQIIFEGIIGSGNRSDIGIDDVKYIHAALPGECDFEGGNLGSLCGFYQDDTDHFDWLLHSGETPSLDTGPFFDSTFQNGSEGHYIYIETTRPDEERTARLIGLPYYKEQGSVCFFSFKYHMFGANVGELNIYIQNNKVWSQSNGTVDGWQDGRISLQNIYGYYEVEIEGIRGDGNLGDIAIDDLSFTGNGCTDIDKCASNPCQNGGTCSQSSSQFKCACVPGWTGLYCQLDIQECRSDPCRPPKSRCIEDLNGYTCECPQGLRGDACTACDVNWKPPDCSSCQPNWVGEDCDTCSNAWTGNKCNVCPDNWSGSNCDQCSLHFSGDECQYCSARFTGPDCVSCSERWTGEECNECSDKWTGENCDRCIEGWTGTICDVASDGNNDENKGVDPENIPAIVAGTVGGVLVILIAASFVVYCQSNDEENVEDNIKMSEQVVEIEGTNNKTYSESL
ncbi:MAM and LDL-receptor class A domain-containing protein 1-like [Anneissia japonica]|uniref:MAM and LDL-receptor class A domain-containing protein 1-like n=1 Tax=Anneissia japonica TaxID=1529436 RepID=UPI001425A303|nr:MAM and LDL-receptor class A domain-containing protein 1-like [Anneissia japonica]